MLEPILLLKEAEKQFMAKRHLTPSNFWTKLKLSKRSITMILRLLLLAAIIWCTYSREDQFSQRHTVDDIFLPRRQATYASSRWVGPIHYKVELDQEYKQIIVGAINRIESETCLHFIDATDLNINVHFLKFTWTFDDICGLSDIGANGGLFQEIKLNDACKKHGVVLHEIMHSLGFAHHFNRVDRREYVTVVPPEGEENSTNYRVEAYFNSFGLPFDFGSVLNYDTTIVLPKDPYYNLTLGQREDASYIDIAQINRYYECTCTAYNTADCKNGYANPKDCTSCICQSGWSGYDCSEVDPWTENSPKTIFVDSPTCEIREFVLGKNDNKHYDKPKTKFVHLDAPVGRYIEVVLYEVSGEIDANANSLSCEFMGLELTIKSFQTTGYYICNNHTDFVSDRYYNYHPFTSEGNKVILKLWTKFNAIKVRMAYRMVYSQMATPPACVPALDCYDRDRSCKNMIDMHSPVVNFALKDLCPASATICLCRNIWLDCWQRIYDCHSKASIRRNLMKENCRATCGYCGKQCKDSLSICPTHRANGLCFSHKSFMNMYCPASCGWC